MALGSPVFYLASLALLAYGSHSLPTQAPAGGVDLSLPVMAAAALTTGSDDTGTDDTMMGAAMENLKENTATMVEAAAETGDQMAEVLTESTPMENLARAEEVMNEVVEQASEQVEAAAENLKAAIAVAEADDDTPEVMDNIDDTPEIELEAPEVEDDFDAPDGDNVNEVSDDKTDDVDDMDSFLDLLSEFNDDVIDDVMDGSDDSSAESSEDSSASSDDDDDDDDDLSLPELFDEITDEFDETEDEVLEEIANMGDDKLDILENALLSSEVEDSDDDSSFEGDKDDVDDFTQASSWFNYLLGDDSSDDSDDDVSSLKSGSHGMNRYLGKMSRVKNMMDVLQAKMAAATAAQQGQCPVYPVSVEEDKVTVTTQDGCQIVIKLKGATVETVNTFEDNYTQRQRVARSVSVDYITTNRENMED